MVHEAGDQGFSDAIRRRTSGGWIAFHQGSYSLPYVYDVSTCFENSTLKMGELVRWVKNVTDE